MATKVPATIDIQDLNKESTITTNIEQEYIVTTNDKIRLILIDWEKAKKLATEWWTYLSMTLSFLIPLFTADFKAFWIFSAEMMKTIFVLLSVIFGVLTIISIIRRICNRDKISIKHCVNKIMNHKS